MKTFLKEKKTSGLKEHKTSGIKEMVATIALNLEERLPRQRTTQRRKPGELVAEMLICQMPNLMELSNVPDRPTKSAEARYNQIAQKKGDQKIPQILSLAF